MKIIELKNIIDHYSSVSDKKMLLLRYRQKTLDSLTSNDYIERSLNQGGIWSWLKTQMDAQMFAKVRIAACISNFVIIEDIQDIPTNVLMLDQDNNWEAYIPL